MILPGDNDAEADDCDEALAFWGLQETTDEDSEAAEEADEPAPEEPRFCLWPCNEGTWLLWHQLQTQWIVDYGRKSGLNYASVIMYLTEVAGIGRKQLRSEMAYIRAMESSAIQVWDEIREASRGQ